MSATATGASLQVAASLIPGAAAGQVNGAAPGAVVTAGASITAGSAETPRARVYFLEIERPPARARVHFLDLVLVSLAEESFGTPGFLAIRRPLRFTAEGKPGDFTARRAAPAFSATIPAERMAA